MARKLNKQGEHYIFARLDIGVDHYEIPLLKLVGTNKFPCKFRKKQEKFRSN
jgi:hypothetical protein